MPTLYFNSERRKKRKNYKRGISALHRKTGNQEGHIMVCMRFPVFFMRLCSDFLLPYPSDEKKATDKGISSLSVRSESRNAFDLIQTVKKSSSVDK